MKASMFIAFLKRNFFFWRFMTPPCTVLQVYLKSSTNVHHENSCSIF
ncbi:hypothetical protein NC651_003433 [Populus alba x Populus x berolinensis]|nr:hypothetical protein NC651_003433 [Populus alba x Populus x berolinensis]